MNTTISDRVFQDITILGDVERTRRPWSVVLGDHLDGFLEGILTLNTISSIFEKDGQNIGLTDAANILNNVGNVWCRQVDDTAQAAQRTMELLDNLEFHKQKAKDPKVPSVKRTTVHPLCLPLSDVKSEILASILSFQTRSKIPAHRNLTSEIPQMSQEKYLPTSDPCTLPLMESEKLRSYYDDRGNKGRDWAEFKVNILPLNREGYYPLETAPGWSKLPLAKRRYTFSVMPKMLDYSIFREDAEGTLIGEAETSGPFHGTDPAQKVPSENETTVPDIPARTVSVKPSKLDSSTFDRFDSCLTLQSLKQSKKIVDIPVALDSANPETPYKRRNKRKVIPKPLEVGPVETEFFKHFWNIPEQQVDLEFVLERWNQRWRIVEEAKKPLKGKKIVKTVRFESVTPAVIPEDSENGGVADESVREDTDVVDDTIVERTYSKSVVDEVADYVDTNEPCLNETEFNIDDLRLLPGASKGDAFNRLNFTQMKHNHHTTQFFDNLDATVLDDSSIAEQCEFLDFHEWEIRLEEFLAEHEPATATFNLENMGQQIVKEYQKNGQRASVSDIVGHKRSTGEVGRSFLSLLDLVNKHVVELDAKSGKAADLSQSAEHLKVKVLETAG